MTNEVKNEVTTKEVMSSSEHMSNEEVKNGEEITTAPENQKSAPQKKEKCLCGKKVRSAVWICCCSCSQWFHCGCVSLGGLTKESVEGIVRWECFQCFRPPFSSVADGSTSVNTRDMRDIMKDEICAVVREEINRAFEGVCTKADIKSAMKSYANIVKNGHKEVMEATSGPTAIKEMCKTLNFEQLEREKKKKNVIVSDVPEPSTTLSGEEKKSHDLTYLWHELDMNKEEIVTCFRTGKMQKDGAGNIKPRPVIVVFKKEETATYWHNDKKGFKSNSHWINADLCRADREAQYFLRQERRKRQEQLEERKKKETERSI